MLVGVIIFRWSVSMPCSIDSTKSHRLIDGTRFAFTVSAVHCLSWSCAFCLCRTLANSTETCLLLLGVWMLVECGAIPVGKECCNRRSGAFNNISCSSSVGLTQRHAKMLEYSSIVVASFSSFCRPTSLLLWVSEWYVQFILQLLNILTCSFCYTDANFRLRTVSQMEPLDFSHYTGMYSHVLS